MVPRASIRQCPRTRRCCSRSNFSRSTAPYPELLSASQQGTTLNFSMLRTSRDQRCNTRNFKGFPQCVEESSTIRGKFCTIRGGGGAQKRCSTPKSASAVPSDDSKSAVSGRSMLRQGRGACRSTPRKKMQRLYRVDGVCGRLHLISQCLLCPNMLAALCLSLPLSRSVGAGVCTKTRHESARNSASEKKTPPEQHYGRDSPFIPPKTLFFLFVCLVSPPLSAPRPVCLPMSEPTRSTSEVTWSISEVTWVHLSQRTRPHLGHPS